MDVRIERDYAKRIWTFSGSYSDHDLQNLNLDEFDQSVLDSPMKNGADILQKLEILFRRYYENREVKSDE